MSPWTLIILCALTLFLLFVHAELEAACPTGCTCNVEHHTVDCRNAGLDRIPWDLPDPSGLKQLDMRGNKIHEIISEIVSYTNLEYLDLSENEMLTIDDNVFDALPRLKYLYLQKNQLSSVTKRTFMGLNTLVELNLSENDLTVLEDDVFADMGKLEELNLAGNQIEEIRDGAFVGLEALRYLDLSDNRLLSIPIQALEHVRNLNSLKLDLNDIENIPSHAFKYLKELRTLSMENNGIVLISENAFYDRSGSDLPQLEKLYLKSNKLAKVPSLALSSLKNLLILDLSQNPIQIIEPDAFRGVERLREVYFNSMPLLEVVRRFAFTEMSNLAVVEMHSNHKLKEIEDEAFLASPNLRRVDLHANQLTSVSASLLAWDSVERLDLRYNVWNCDCHLQWLKDVLISLPTNTSRAYGKQVRCASPEELASTPITQLYPHEFRCKDQTGHQFEDRIMLAIIGTFCGVLTVIMFFLFWKHGYFTCHKKQRTAKATYMVHKNISDAEVRSRLPSIPESESEQVEESMEAESENITNTDSAAKLNPV